MKKKSTNAYSKETRDEVLQYADKHTVKEAVEKFKVHASTIHFWKKKLKTAKKPKMVVLSPPAEEVITLTTKYHVITITGESIEVKNNA